MAIENQEKQGLATLAIAMNLDMKDEVIESISANFHIVGITIVTCIRGIIVDPDITDPRLGFICMMAAKIIARVWPSVMVTAITAVMAGSQGGIAFGCRVVTKEKRSGSVIRTMEIESDSSVCGFPAVGNGIID